MTQECFMSGYQRKSFTENFRWESAPKSAGINAIKTPLKLPLRISIHHQNPGNRLHMIEQSCAASSNYEAKRVRIAE